MLNCVILPRGGSGRRLVPKAASRSDSTFNRVLEFDTAPRRRLTISGWWTATLRFSPMLLARRNSKAFGREFATLVREGHAGNIGQLVSTISRR